MGSDRDAAEDPAPVSRRRRVRIAFGLVAVAVPAILVALALLADAWRWRRPLVLGKTDSPVGLAILGDGRTTLVLDRETGGEILEPAFLKVSRRRVFTLPPPAPQTGPGGAVGHCPFAVSPDEKLAFLGDGWLSRLVPLARSDAPAAIDTRAVVSAAFSRDGRLLVTASRRGFEPATLWDVASGQPLRTIETAPAPTSVDFSSDGGSILSVSVHSIVISDTGTGLVTCRHDAVRANHFQSAGWFLPEPDRIAIFSETLEVLDAKTWKVDREIAATEPWNLDCAALSSDRRLIAFSVTTGDEQLSVTQRRARVAVYLTATGSRIADVVLADQFPEIAAFHEKDTPDVLALSPEGDACAAVMHEGLIVRFPIPRGGER
jgi:hypothetical protein